jgi:hypothetical protein
MIKKVILICALFSVAILFNACKSKSTTEPPGSTVSGDFFPNGDGTAYKYNTVTTDSNGTKTSGTRSTTYSGSTVIGSSTFQNEIDTVTFSGLSTVAHSFFLKTSSSTGSSVEYTLDTTGLYQFIPPAYMQYVQLDSLLRLIQTPFHDGDSWSVFNLSLKISIGSGASLTFNPVNVKAYYEGMEQVPLNLVTGNVTENAAKIKYVLSLQIPNPQNPLVTPPTVTYNTYAWFVSGIGIVQWQGNGTVFGAFSGGGINFGDTTSTVIQSLVSYKIK